MYFFILFVWKNERWFLKNVIATDLRHIVVKNASQQRAWANRPCFFWHFFLRRIFKILICLAERLEMSLAIFLLFPLNWSLRHSIIWIKNREVISMKNEKFIFFIQYFVEWIHIKIIFAFYILNSIDWSSAIFITIDRQVESWWIVVNFSAIAIFNIVLESCLREHLNSRNWI